MPFAICANFELVPIHDLGKLQVTSYKLQFRFRSLQAFVKLIYCFRLIWPIRHVATQCVVQRYLSTYVDMLLHTTCNLSDHVF